MEKEEDAKAILKLLGTGERIPFLEGIAIAVFPTSVGVFLKLAAFERLFYRLPHVRGGVSLKD